MRGLLCAAAGLAIAAGMGTAAELSLKPTKDARILGHSSERNQNCGKSARLRTTGIGRGSAEFVIMDFDRAAVRAFVEKNKEKTLSGKLVMVVRQVQGVGETPVKMEVAAIDSASAWNEGSGTQKPAKKGESCALAARFDEQKWTAPDGKEVEQFRDLVWDGAEVKCLLNGEGVALSRDSAGSKVEIPLSADFVRHLGREANCQGLFLFHREPAAKLDIFSREQAQKSPLLVLTAK